MSSGYRIDPRRGADDEVRRVVADRIERADEALALPGDRRAEGVHEARKRLKEIRAVVRLLRPHLGRRFRGENTRYRDIARGLSGMRDAAALVECWDALAADEPRRFSSTAMQRVRERLAARADEAGQGADADAIAAARQSLGDARAALTDWPLPRGGFALFRGGLARTFGDGARALAAVEKGVTDERLHEWRKRVKDHWYHTCLFERCWPEMLEARRRCLKGLSDALGDDHDLAVMHALMAEEPALFGAAATRAAIVRAVSRRRTRLTRRAVASGRRLYAEESNVLVARWRAYWRLTRKGR
ncbi:hypothetical protein KBTX_03894 [wastewater metagenome]|uniref:CHAD domain-containing protein n=2 Tax=unclassified sequences TaxID=12908 RepID=A0A5B8RG22_9ZZZZ|nr:CHAD domain-containing protein [Arhodomonas sp. KWT]QEA07536.1 hypothetical protein KBTEX_03894 [uncultured organism]